PRTGATRAHPDVRQRGRRSYFNPQLTPSTRTGQVRVEVPNLRNELRLGMLAEAHIQASDRAAVTLVPRSAVQHVADRSVVYLAKSGAPGEFTEREVRLGQPSDEGVQVLSGVIPVDPVVADGSVYLR